MSTTIQQRADAVRFGTIDELRADGRLTGKIGSIPVLVVWHEEAPYAIEDRCPHLGFPLHQGTVEAGLITCHWHHARFDLASRLHARSLGRRRRRASTSRVEAVDVFVAPRPAGAGARALGAAPARRARSTRSRWSSPRPCTACSSRRRRAADPRGSASSSASATAPRAGAVGLTVLTCIANLLPHLDADDRPLALVHALRFVAATPPVSRRGSPSARSGAPVSRSSASPAGTAGWSRPATPTAPSARCRPRSPSADLDEVEAMMFAAVTDHVFIDGGHALDFTNKAFEALTTSAPTGAPLARLARAPGVRRRPRRGGAASGTTRTTSPASSTTPSRCSSRRCAAAPGCRR